MANPRARPILMSAPMVRALFDGRKTQTRRIVNRLSGVGRVTEFQSSATPGFDFTFRDRRLRWNDMTTADVLSRCPYGQPGDLLWVRETWQHAPQKYCRCPQPSEPSPCDAWSAGTGCVSNRGDVVYAADGSSAPHWRPSIFMPRWASRLTLRLTAVRVEQLQDISDEDAIAEGLMTPSPVVAYRDLWESIHGPGSWDANPWVWRIAFDVIKRNVDESGGPQR